MTHAQSLIVVQTVLSACFGYNMYLRRGPIIITRTYLPVTTPYPSPRVFPQSRLPHKNPLPEDNFGNGTLSLTDFCPPLTTVFLARLVVGDSESPRAWPARRSPSTQFRAMLSFIPYGCNVTGLTLPMLLFHQPSATLPHNCSYLYSD